MIQKAAVISGDILASTSLDEADRLKVLKNTKKLLKECIIVVLKEMVLY